MLPTFFEHPKIMFSAIGYMGAEDFLALFVHFLFGIPVNCYFDFGCLDDAVMSTLFLLDQCLVCTVSVLNQRRMNEG